MKKMIDQMSIFNFLEDLQPGDYVTRFGKRLGFDDLHVGDLVVDDCSTQSAEWYKVIRIENIFPDAEDGGRIIFSYGKRHPGYISRLEMERDWAPSKVYAVWNGEPRINDRLDEPCRSCELTFESMPCFDRRGDAYDYYRTPEEREKGICK